MDDVLYNHRMKESSFGILFRHWVFAHAQQLISSTFEIKQTSIDSIPFSCVEDHQVDFSTAIRWGDKGALIRNESGSVGAPDYSFYKNAPAFIVIKYPTFFVLIDIDTFLLEKKRSKRKSLTSERAKEIAWKTVDTTKIKTTPQKRK